MFFSEQSVGKTFFFFFLKFFERRDKFRFLIKKKVEGKNKVIRDLSSPIIEKSNGYEIMKHELARKVKVEFVPIDIVYEPVYDENVPVPCHFTGKIHLVYRSYIRKRFKGKEKVGHPTVRQCHCCEIFFAKSKENMKNHIQVCAAKEGITYSFNKGEIISFQDNFKYLGDVPFTVYFDFETTTGGTVFFYPNMFVVSCCQIYSFHPSLNLGKIVIFWSFQQNAEEIYNLSHFRQEQVAFFDRTAFHQLKDAASAVLAREKSTSLAELFPIELKFTIDTLNA